MDTEGYQASINLQPSIRENKNSMPWKGTMKWHVEYMSFSLIGCPCRCRNTTRESLALNWNGSSRNASRAPMIAQWRLGLLSLFAMVEELPVAFFDDMHDGGRERGCREQ